MRKAHTYEVGVEWTGNTGSGTSGYRDYQRSHVIKAKNKVDIEASSDPAFRGDRTKYNPEELLLASLSSCHMLWFLHLCTDEGIIVIAYEDSPIGRMQETENGGGYFTEAVLRPKVILQNTISMEKLEEIHERAHELCFIANSVNFPVRVEFG